MNSPALFTEVPIPPTGRRVTLTGFDPFRIEGGKIVEMWQEVDQLGLLQQLGAVTEPGQQPVGSLSSGQEPPS